MDKREERARLIAQMRGMNDKALAEKRGFTDEEQKQYSELEAQVRSLAAEIEAEARSAELDGFSTQPPAPQADSGGADERRADESVFEVRRGANGQVELRTAMTQGDGGAAIAPEKFIAELEREIAKEALVYARVSKIPVSGAGSLGLPYEAADVDDAEWTQEVPASDIEEDKKWKFGKRELNPNNLTKLIKISKQLLSTSALPIDTLAQDRIREKLTAAFENTIINGTGSGQPLGLFVASADGIPADRDVATAGSAIAGDDLINVYMKLRPAYRRKAVWVMSTEVLKDVMKLKDSDGQYLWHVSLRVGEPSTLLGLPVIESEYAPTAKTAGTYQLLLGDLSHYKFAYWRGLELTVAKELFAGKHQVGFFGYTLADGQPTLPAAFARLKIKAS